MACSLPRLTFDRFKRILAPFALAALSLLWVSEASAHVVFTSPERDAVLVAGSTVEIGWRDSISHDTIAYHLDFYPDAAGEPQALARDVPPDQQSLEWVVPEEPCQACVLVVTQDNTAADYSDRLDFSIVSNLGGSAGETGQGGSGGEEPTSGGASSTGGVPASGGQTGGQPAGGVGGTSATGGAGASVGSGGQAPAGGTGPEIPPMAGPGGCSLSSPLPGGGWAALALLGAWVLILGVRRRFRLRVGR